MPHNDTGAQRVLLVVPAYNESESIERVVATIREAGYDFVVINDGSTDDTEQILRRIDANHVTLCQNLGIGGAVQTGFKYAYENGYDVAVQFDGDGQHDVSYVAALAAPLISGEADLSVGSRFVGAESKFKSSAARRAGIKFLSAVLKVCAGKRIYDVTSGFRAANRKVIELFAANYPDDYPEPESLAYVLGRGCKVCEVPVAMHERQGGTSSISGFKTVYYMVKVGLSILLLTSVRARRD